MTATFAAAGEESTAFSPNRQAVLGLIMDAAMDAAMDAVDLGFEVKDSAGAWVPVLKPDGNAYTLAAGPSECYYADEEVGRLLAAFAQVRLTSSVAQGDETVVEIVSR